MTVLYTVKDGAEPVIIWKDDDGVFLAQVFADTKKNALLAHYHEGMLKIVSMMDPNGHTQSELVEGNFDWPVNFKHAIELIRDLNTNGTLPLPLFPVARLDPNFTAFRSN